MTVNVLPSWGYTGTMETNRIDFVPTENHATVAAEVRDWLLANAFMGLNPDRMSTRDLPKYESGGHLYLELGGYVADPERPGHQAAVEATFNVDLERGDHCEDPEGTMWYPSTVRAQVNWPSYGSMGRRLSRMRVAMIDAAVQLRVHQGGMFVQAASRGRCLWRIYASLRFWIS